MYYSDLFTTVKFTRYTPRPPPLSPLNGSDLELDDTDLEPCAPVDLVLVEHVLVDDGLLELRLPVLGFLLARRHDQRRRARVAAVLVADRAAVRTCTSTKVVRTVPA